MTLQTPCVGVCSIGLGDDVCRGCGRSLDEIRDWSSYTDAQRQAVMQRLQAQGRDASRTTEEKQHVASSCCQDSA